MKKMFAVLFALLLALSLAACQRAAETPDAVVDVPHVSNEHPAPIKPANDPAATQYADAPDAPSGEASVPDDAPEYAPLPALWPPVVGEEGDMTVYACTGSIDIPVPTQYLEALIIESDPDHQMDEHRQTLLSFSEKASVEAARLDYPGEDTGFGWLCSIGRLDEPGYEEWLAADIPGETLFATDGDYYYIHSVPTDVTFYRAGGEAPSPETEGAEDFRTLFQWSCYAIVPDILLFNPGLTDASSTE